MAANNIEGVKRILEDPGENAVVSQLQVSYVRKTDFTASVCRNKSPTGLMLFVLHI